MRSKFAKDHVRVNETAGLDVFVGIYLGSFGQIGWLIDDEAARIRPIIRK
jgi:hypothetical protein